MSRFIHLLCLLVFCASPTWAQDDKAKKNQPEEPQLESQFKLKKEVEQILHPLFKSIAGADVSRATVSLSAETLNRGVVIERQESTYQIASKHPNQFTVYLKQPEQRTRVYSDGKQLTVALAPDAYYRADEVMDVFDAVFDMPVPMGQYPEAVFALTFAGADPSLSLLGGMESVEIVDRNKFRGKIPAVHLQGVQDDGVVWDFWVSDEKQPKPLRLLVDLTIMLRDNARMRMPEGVTYELRYDFLTWRVTGDVDDSLFKYSPPKGATEYESLDDYYEQMAKAAANHPLLGKPIPDVKGRTLSGKTFTTGGQKGRIVVIDFWATWCKPCIEAMPIMEQTIREHQDDGVVFLSVNVGEKKDKIAEFVKKQGWKSEIILDEDMAFAKAFKADVMPMTIVVSKAGIAESIHFGYVGPEQLKKRLEDEFEVLSVGGRIASAKPVPNKKDKPKETKPAKKPKK